MTIEIPSELLEQVERVARAKGTDAQSFVVEATRRALENGLQANGNGDQADEAKRLAAIRRLHGCLADSELSVDEFLRERSEQGRKEAEL